MAPVDLMLHNFGALDGMLHACMVLSALTLCRRPTRRLIKVVGLVWRKRRLNFKGTGLSFHLAVALT